MPNDAPPPPPQGYPQQPPHDQQQYQQQPYGQYQEQPKADPKAIWSMILGIVSFVLCCCGILAIPAIILGHMSMKSIDQSGGWLTGKGMAITGLILGYVVLVIWVISMILQFVMGVPMLEDIEQMMQQMQQY